MFIIHMACWQNKLLHKHILQQKPTRARSISPHARAARRPLGQVLTIEALQVAHHRCILQGDALPPFVFQAFQLLGQRRWTSPSRCTYPLIHSVIRCHCLAFHCREEIQSLSARPLWVPVAIGYTGHIAQRPLRPLPPLFARGDLLGALSAA